jgi:mannose-6-phosphate isomerase-like protein (cupin superfamily)
MPSWFVPGPFPDAFETDERCTITELLNLPESPEVSLALAVVDPGVTTRLHAVEGTLERYVILRGRGIVEVDGVARPVRAGDRVLIPPGAPQRIRNDGEGELAFYCLCTPRFRPEAYRDLEEV